MKYSKKCFALSFLLIVLLFNAACADSPAAVADDADFPVVPASKNVPKFRVETVAAIRF